MRRFGLRSLKWPFGSKEVDQLLASLERHERTILLGLQIDQTTLLVDIQQGVKQLGLGDDKSVPAALKAHFIVPFSPNANFVHRPEIEGWIRDRYAEAGRQRMGIVGMGDFGKS
ncbi:hypothetical protein MN608_11684 [Microdochium nivale]|nr:hypothetical protein MN608_11684 [Microdochium nivale]